MRRLRRDLRRQVSLENIAEDWHEVMRDRGPRGLESGRPMMGIGAVKPRESRINYPASVEKQRLRGEFRKAAEREVPGPLTARTRFVRELFTERAAKLQLIPTA